MKITIIEQTKHIAGADYFWPVVLVVITCAFHMAIISMPDVPMFDEQHFVPEAVSIINGNGVLHPEHPPLAKLMIASGIAIFGDNPSGWRLFSVLFGSLYIVFFYLICRSLKMPRIAGVFSTFMLAFEMLTFTQASIAMLDVYSATFLLLAFYLFLERKYVSSGISVGLSALAKLTGMLALPVISLYWLMTRQTGLVKVITLGIGTLASFLVLMFPLDYLTTGHPASPVSRLQFMLAVSSSMTFARYAHPYLSRPLDWVTQYISIPYWYQPAYSGAISPTVWALIIPAAGYLVYLAVKRNPVGLFGIAWFTGTYLLWIPANYVSDRISFLYYFYPSVGAICLAIGYGLYSLGKLALKNNTAVRYLVVSLIGGYLLLHFAFFIILSPLFAE